VTISGRDGVLRWGYFQAAGLSTWTVTRDGGRWTLAGTVTGVDAFRVTQRPLAFVATHATGCWRWPVETLAIADGRLTAALGPQED
jgi:hypothetical protein